MQGALPMHLRPLPMPRRTAQPLLPVISKEFRPMGATELLVTCHVRIIAAGSLLAAFPSNADPSNRALAQEPGARRLTLSEIYRNSGDIELQNKVAPFNNFYHVGPGWLAARGSGEATRGKLRHPRVIPILEPNVQFEHSCPAFAPWRAVPRSGRLGRTLRRRLARTPNGFPADTRAN